MSLSMENIIKGLKEVTRKIEEGGEVDSNTMGIVEEFLKNFPSRRHALSIVLCRGSCKEETN